MTICISGCRAQTSQKDSFARPAAPLYNRQSEAIVTHRFWAAKNWLATNITKDGGPYTMFAEPLAVQTTPSGLLVGASHAITVNRDSFVHPIQMDFVVGTRGLKVAHAAISQQTDRMVQFDYERLKVRVGRGMPFVYATGSDRVTVTFLAPPQIFANRGNILGVRSGPNEYGLFCPNAGNWSQDDKVFTCLAPKGHDYLSVALLPSPDALNYFTGHAFSFPLDTAVSWRYDEVASRVSTTFNVIVQQMEGVAPKDGFLEALYPHQYAALVGGKASDIEYVSARGPMKVLAANQFTTSDVYHGILPFLPLPATFDRTSERVMLAKVAAEGRGGSSDTYNEGKQLNRVAQLLPLAAMTDSGLMLQRFADVLRSRINSWAAPGDRTAQKFEYDPGWQTLIGYPAAFGSNTQLNDHHFHYGYWIQAAAMLGLFDPAWMEDGDHRKFLRELSSDIANVNPEEKRYPLLRHFDPYAGHSWASGQAPFGDGENEESSSEAVNAWAALILFATEAGDRRLLDAAVWMYTLETTSAAYYWFNDAPVRTFPKAFDRVQIANLFDGKSDTATWFGNAPEFEHGIEFLPFTGASLYLGKDPAYTHANLAEVMQQTGGSLRQKSEFWPDLMEMYEAFYDPQAALRHWQDTPFTFDGETRAHEFAWISSLAAYGRVDVSVTADCTFYSVFKNSAGGRTHIAFNPAASGLQVHFSDGYKVTVAGRSMSAEGRRIPLSAALPR